MNWRFTSGLRPHLQWVASREQIDQPQLSILINSRLWLDIVCLRLATHYRRDFKLSRLTVNLSNTWSENRPLRVKDLKIWTFWIFVDVAICVNSDERAANQLRQRETFVVDISRARYRKVAAGRRNRGESHDYAASYFRLRTLIIGNAKPGNKE